MPLKYHSPEAVAHLGAAECARREREFEAGSRAFTLRTAPVLARQGFRWPEREDEPGARYELLRIDNREIDNGYCKLWVVPLFDRPDDEPPCHCAGGCDGCGGGSLMRDCRCWNVHDYECAPCGLCKETRPLRPDPYGGKPVCEDCYVPQPKEDHA
jgi:hypothetical protein